jgi:Leucine-rich repeat (LRR) protein
LQTDPDVRKFTADGAAFAPLSYLQTLTLAFTGVNGTLTVGNNVHSVDALGNAFTSFASSNRAALYAVRMIFGGLSGGVPSNLLNAPHLEILDLRYNGFTSIAPEWNAPKLRTINLQGNQIGVRGLKIDKIDMTKLHVNHCWRAACARTSLSSATGLVLGRSRPMFV